MSADESMAMAFNKVADCHDHVRWDRPPSAFDAEVLAELTHLAKLSRGFALFLGSGSGREAVDFAVEGWHCDLVDISSRMIELARSRLGNAGVRLHQGEATLFLSQSSGTYDLIAMIGELLGYVQSPARLLGGVARRLRPDGKVVFTWVDSTRLTDTESADGTGTVQFREREDLVIRAWTESIMNTHLLTVRLRKIKDIASGAYSPRRCWVAVKE